ncbi:MAG: ABC transporter permease [Planctomycetes bacterium]|nr:ABC transporter permease [Planctomycetota bacterium]MCB9905214.1 ABC transporter permease [Planctomycetota bacterium]
MNGVLTILRRELAGLFYSPLAWILLCVGLFLVGWDFTTTIEEARGDVVFGLNWAAGGGTLYWGVMVFLPPLLTMRMISEEARTGMLEFLQTAPVTDFAVVLGKFCAAWIFMSLFWSALLVYAATIHALGVDPDWGAVIGSYLGAVSVSALFCAIGLLCSATTSTPLLAAFFGIVANIVAVQLPRLASLPNVQWLKWGSGQVDLVTSLQRGYLAGVLDSQVVVFFCAWTALFLFLSIRAVEARRWR